MNTMMKVGRLAAPRAGAAALMAVMLSSCAVLPWTAQHERILDLASGREISCAELARQVAASDFVLLGEQHDQVAHHQRRGALMLQVKTLGPTPVAVVAEHLPRGARVVFGEDLLGSLRAAGFRADLWEWPVHQALFASVAATAWPLTGGNLRDDELRAVMKQGPSSLPTALQASLAGAPLDAAAQATLDADLTAAHGGSIPPDRLQAMRMAQRARDASMLTALQATGAHPAVLVAGNGHVRQDYGVPQLIRSAQPTARVLSVGLLSMEQLDGGAARPYSHLWVVDPDQSQRACGEGVSR